MRIQTQVVDAVFQLANSFDAHAECKAGVFIGIDSEILQHFRMHHSAAEYLHPTAVLAYITTCAAADQAADVHFGAGFGEWKIRRAETYLHLFAKHFLHEKIKGLLQVGERNIFVYIQSFGLVEKTMRPGADGFIPVYAAGTNDPDGRFLLFHHPGLYAAGMGA